MFGFFKKVKIREPEVGDTNWTIKNDSPWAKEDATYIKILDVKDGWVRYYMTPMFPDERKEMDIFLLIYEEKL